jgi:hypothetical protein
LIWKSGRKSCSLGSQPSHGSLKSDPNRGGFFKACSRDSWDGILLAGLFAGDLEAASQRKLYKADGGPQARVTGNELRLADLCPSSFSLILPKRFLVWKKKK